MSITLQDKLKRYFASTPNLYEPQANPIILGLYTAWAQEDCTILEALEALKLEFFVKTADSIYLDLLASNSGVKRPPDYLNDDDHFRELIPILGYDPKVNLNSIYALEEIVFGDLLIKSHVTARCPEPYVLCQALGFASDGTNVGTFTVASATYLTEGFTNLPILGAQFLIKDDNSPLAVGIMTSLTGSGPYTVQMDQGTLDLSAYTQAQNARIFVLEDFIVHTESGTATVHLLASDFVDPLNATSDEIATAINARQTLVTAETFLDINSGLKYLRLFTNTPGSAGFIQVYQNSANASLCFDNVIHRNFQVDPDSTDGGYSITIPQINSANRTLRGSWHFHDPSQPTIQTQSGTFPNLDIFDTRPLVDDTHPYWPGPFMFDPTAIYSIRQTSSTITTTLLQGSNQAIPLPLVDASGFPSPAVGKVEYFVLGFGTPLEEGPIKYFSRPSNLSLIVDPTYTFRFQHLPGETIHYVVNQGYEPRDDGSDYATFLTENRITSEIIQELIQKIKAGGLVYEFVDNGPIYRYAII